jgi:endoglucanase
LKGWGVNAIRPALLGHLIQPRDSQPAKPPYKYNPEGWKLLDSLVAWCERWQVGIIWDMHAGPGSPNGQLYSDAPGGSATLWSDSASTWPRTTDLWFKIADRYKTRPCIIGYDFENEPLLSNMGYNPALLRKLFVQLTDTIRTVDTVGIMVVEGQWYGRDFSILEPLNWDKHLVLSYHEYNPMITNCSNMKGSQNGFSWDVCAARTKYNIPVWVGETGAKPPPYTINAQSTDFFNSNNIGWSWWDYKNFVSQNQPWNCPKTAGFQTILDYWNNGGTKPSAANAKTWLFDQARRTNRSYCTFQPTMVSSLHPLNPNGVVSVQNGPAQKVSGSISVSKRAGAVLITMPDALSFSAEIISSNGQMVRSGRGLGGSWQVDCSGQPAGLYFVKIASADGCVVKRLVIAR